MEPARLCRRLAPWATLIVVVLLAWPAGALAAKTVNTTADNGPVGGECAGAAGDCSIRQAIDAAVPGETISVPAGTYTLAGPLGVSKSLTIQGENARTTIVNGNGSTPFAISGSPIAATLSRLTISAGHEVGSSFLSGGAVANTANQLTLDQDIVAGTTLEGSSALNRGAGVNNRMGGVLVITNSTISGNVERATGTAGNQGAGIFNSGGTVTVRNSTITGNSQEVTGSGSSSGAGIVNLGSTVTLENTTVADNTGSPAVNNIATLTATNTIISGGSGTCDAPVTSLGHNIDGADACGFHASGDQVNTNPLLAALANNGGQTDTMALTPGSPAINAGSVCLPADQRGVVRPQGDACDIGAFEYPAAMPAVATGAARAVGPTSATLAGTVVPNASSTTAFFDWGTTTAYGNVTPGQPIGAGTTPQAVSAALAGLRPSTRIHFRVVATNALGTSVGADQVLTTSRRGPSCKLTPGSARVGKRGAITVKAGCAQAATVRLSGKVKTRLKVKGRRRPVTKVFRLRAQTAKLRPGSAVVLRVKLPGGALSRLARGAKVSVSYTLSATNSTGTSRVTAVVRSLR